MTAETLIAVLSLDGMTGQEARDLLDSGEAPVLRERADSLAAHVPPVTAGPLTDHDRRFRDAAAELNHLADALEPKP